MITKVTKYVELPQPKKVVTPKMKELNKQTGVIKKKLGVKGKTEPGDLIRKSKELGKKERSAINVLI